MTGSRGRPGGDAGAARGRRSRRAHYTCDRRSRACDRRPRPSQRRDGRRHLASTRAACFYNQSEWWRAANGYCMKLGGDVCHVAPQGKHCHAAFARLAPALLALEAEVEWSQAAERVAIPAFDLYHDDGASHLNDPRARCSPAFSADSIRVPLWPDIAKRALAVPMDFPLAGCSVRATRFARLPLQASRGAGPARIRGDRAQRHRGAAGTTRRCRNARHSAAGAKTR